MLPLMLLSLNLLPFDVYAMRGKGVTAVTGETATCRILERDENQKLQHQCSGTLTNEQTVLTAAHCLLHVLEEKLTISVECGQESIDYAQATFEFTSRGGKVMTGGVKFKEKRVAKELAIQSDYDGYRKGDVGRLILDHAIKAVSPVPVATKDEAIHVSKKIDEYNSSIPETTCLSEGYGLNENEYSGILQRMTPQELKLTPENIFNYWDYWFDTYNLVFEKEQLRQEIDCANHSGELVDDLELSRRLKKLGLNHATLAFGDSGGPLYCGVGPDFDMKLMGIASGTSADPQVFMFANWWTLPLDSTFVPLDEFIKHAPFVMLPREIDVQNKK